MCYEVMVGGQQHVVSLDRAVEDCRLAASRGKQGAVPALLYTVRHYAEGCTLRLHHAAPAHQWQDNIEEARCARALPWDPLMT